MGFMLYGSGDRWPSEKARLQYITDFCQGRALAIPIKTDNGWKMIRYRSGKRLLFADTASDYNDIVFYPTWHSASRARGMYATNAVYRARKDTLNECNEPDNVVSYLGYIDLDDVLGNEEEGLEVIKDCLSKLPQNGTWLLLSGTGIHINVNGFCSHVHAQSFFEARGIVDDRKSEVEVHMLNDVSRIGTVPYESYKKEDDVICFPFMPWELDAVFDRDDWREYHASEVPMPWCYPVSPEVEAWNGIEMKQLVHRKISAHKLDLAGFIGRVDRGEPGFWDALPGCLRAAFKEDRPDHQRRIVAFITSFMSKIGLDFTDIINIGVARGVSFSNPLDITEAERIVDSVINAGLEPPGCGKIRWKRGEGFPTLNLADANLCPYGKDASVKCVAKSPWKQYCLNRRCKT